MKKHNRRLVASIVLFIISLIFRGLSIYQYRQYEKYALTVMATITNIEKKEVIMETETMTDGYEYTYYGEYVVDDKLYTDKYLGYRKTYDDESLYSVGDLYFVEVNSLKPSERMLDGGYFSMISFGFLLGGVLTYVVYKKRQY